MYGSENWSLNRPDERKIEDIRFWTKKRISDIREQLGVFNTNYKLTQYKINWREHIPKKNFNYKPEGRRNIGRSQTRWEDDFREEGTGQGAYSL